MKVKCLDFFFFLGKMLNIKCLDFYCNLGCRMIYESLTAPIMMMFVIQLLHILKF